MNYKIHSLYKSTRETDRNTIANYLSICVSSMNFIFVTDNNFKANSSSIANIRVH